MQKIVKWIAFHPKSAIALVLVITLIFTSFTANLQEETSLESLFPNYPEVGIMEDIQNDFGNQEPVIILIRGEDVLTPEYFRKTADITEKIWKDAIINSALMEPKDESITSLPEFLAVYQLSLKGNFNPSKEQVLEEIRSFVSKDEIIRTFNAFLEDPNVPQVMKDYVLVFLPKTFDGDVMKSNKMVIYISLDAALSNGELEKTELRIESTAKSVDAKTLTYGFKLLNYYYVKTEERLIPAFLIALILILALMILNFKGLSDVAISLTTLFLAMLWTFGLAGLLGWKIDVMAGMVPILILGLGIDFSFHVLMNYREKLKETSDPKKSAYLVLSTVGIALLLAMVTTVVGFSSNGISKIPSMRHFGFLSAFSILAIFVLNLTFVPAMRELLDLRKAKRQFKTSKKRELVKNGVIKRLLWLIKKPSIVVIFLIIIFGVALPGWVLGFGMKASYDPTGELATDLDITKAHDILNEEFDVGTETVFIRVDGKLTDPKFWEELEKAVENMNDDKYVVVYDGKARVEWILSLVPFFTMEDQRVAGAYILVDKNRDGKIDGDVTPAELKAFLSALYETPMGKYYLHKDENGNFDGLIIRVATRTKLGYHGKKLLEELKEDFKAINANVSFTGMPIIWARGLDDIRDSMANSIFLCLAFAFIVLPIAFGLFHRSLFLGFLTALPPFITIGWLFMTMKFLGIPLNMMTAMVGAIIVGIGIDYPIHIANRWALERKEGKTLEECYAISLSSTGKEVLYSALTTLVAFGVFILIPIPVITQFAITTLFGLIYSFVGAVLTLPLLLRLFWHRGD
ncbi:MMPL family transporter [Thermococcus argininiproducens]|uniref:MMPL family transporter n=1 Tax=Thermococcus argininiproducens TaxID=2866384 RepID=A0A9E7SCU9_9EURY|nr:MMPL family transporter [Thermococcus argininiproducens]USH00145.1 MMPL family transporter [Thermococcus argininiproducens]